jgi:methyltransferase (TIGR00027 family)
LTFQRVEVDYGDPQADDRLAGDLARGLNAGDSPLRAYLQGRTRFFDTIVVDAIEAGIGQILVGAAGYDGRAWRYSKPGVTWFEVDHPSTQRDKLSRLASLGIETSHVRFIAADFAVDAIAAPVIQSGFAPSQAASFLLEGVAVYLNRAILESVLQEFRDLAAPGSILAISLSASTGAPGASERRSRFQSAVEAIGEPALTTVEPHQVDPLLSATGWRRRTRPDSDSGGHARRVAAGFLTAEPA